MGPGEDLGICCSDGTQDVYPHHPEDLDMDWSDGGYRRTIADLYLISRYLQSNFSKILSIITDIKESGKEVTLCESWQVARCVLGNSFYRAGDHAMATTKYRKVSYPHIQYPNILFLFSAASTSPCCATPWAAPRTRRRSCELLPCL